MLKEGDKAPDFTIVDSEGAVVSLKDFRGREVVLYFFPKANTSGCTQETCDFRDHYAAIKKKGAVVLGVSADNLKSQSNFSRKLEVPFSLLCDQEKKALLAYGVWKEKSLYGRKFMGIERTTIIIGKDGKVKRIFPKVRVKGHVEEVLHSLQ